MAQAAEARRRQLTRVTTAEAITAPQESTECSGDAWQQLKVLEARLRRVAGLTACGCCCDSEGVTWRLPLRSLPAAPLTRKQRAGMTARLLTCTSATFNDLCSACGTGGPLEFDTSKPTRRLLADVTSMIDHVTARMANEFPAVCSDASATLVGGWATRTALAAERPSFDFVLTLPNWPVACGHCVCGAKTGVTTSLHQACICSLHSVLLQVVLGTLSRSRSLSVTSASFQPGSDAENSLKAKRVNFVLRWSDGDSGRQCDVSVRFGAPVVIVDEDKDVRLRGHLLLGFSRLSVLRLALQESLEPPNPRLELLTRATKFALKVGDCLRAEVGEGEGDPHLSFYATSAVRRVSGRFTDCPEAFEGSNLEDRLIEILDELLEARPIRVYSETHVVATDTQKRLSPAVASVVGRLRRGCADAERRQESLVPPLLRFFRLRQSDSDSLEAARQARLLAGLIVT